MRLLRVALVALVAAASAGAAQAQSSSKAAERLGAVPVFFLADASGAPIIEPGADAPIYYLTRTQASLGLGMLRGQLGSAGISRENLEIGVTDLAAVESLPGDPVFMKPTSSLDVAVNHPGVPLFIVRDASGSPFTTRDETGARHINFFLDEADARAFVGRVLRETGRNWSDIRLSVIGLDVVMKSMLTSEDPAIGNWVIQPSAETRNDAASLRAEARLILSDSP